MGRNRVKQVIPRDETDPPKIFSASSLFLKDWLRQEVQKATQEIVFSDNHQQAEEESNEIESKSRLSRNRKKC